MLSAGSGIGATGALHTQVTQLEAVTTSGGITVSNTGALQIGGLTSITPAVNVSGSGAISLSASGPLTVAANIAGPANVTLTANEAGPTATDNLVVKTGVTVSSTAGDVILLAGDDINVAGSVSAPRGNLDLRSGFGDIDNEGVIGINGALTAAGNIALDINTNNSALPAGENSVTETGTGSLVGGSLLLLDFFPSVTHAISLDASATNNVASIAASTECPISFLNHGPLVVAAVTSGEEGVTASGVFATNRDIFLGASSGDITVSTGINAGTGTLKLSSGGGISQAAPGRITAGNLGLQAVGNVELAAANPLNHITGAIALAASGPGSFIHFSSDSNITIDSVAASGPFGGVAGIHTHDGDIDLIAVGASSSITVQQPISTIPASDDHGAAAIRLQAGAGITESGFTGLITTDDLAVFAAGPVTLLTFSNIIRGHVSIIDTAAGQPVQFTALSDFTVGAVTGDSLFGDAVGIKSNNGEILLTSGSGIIAVEQSINSNAVGAGGTAGITLNGVHGVTVDAVILAPGPVSITTPDVGSVGLHQDIRIHANGVITSGSTIDLNSADGILIDAGASLTAQGALTMEVGMRSPIPASAAFGVRSAR